jgi:hypothetical protein
MAISDLSKCLEKYDPKFIVPILALLLSKSDELVGGCDQKRLTEIINELSQISGKAAMPLISLAILPEAGDRALVGTWVDRICKGLDQHFLEVASQDSGTKRKFQQLTKPLRHPERIPFIRRPIPPHTR